LKKFWSAYISPLFFTRRCYAALTGCVVLFVFRFFLPWLGILPYAVLVTLMVLFIMDYFLLFKTRKVFLEGAHMLTGLAMATIIPFKLI
jgi:hypothetical protein